MDIKQTALAKLAELREGLESGRLVAIECSQNAEVDDVALTGVKVKTGHRLITVRVVDRMEFADYQAARESVERAHEEEASPPTPRTE